jgi:L-fuculose-phosphate aldolase
MDDHSGDTLIRQNVEQTLGAHFGAFPYGIEESFAIGCRLLAAEGHSRSLLGQVTARHPSGTYLSLPFGLGLDEADAAELVHFDRDMRSLRDGFMVHPGIRFHLWIYDRRPDVQAIVHTHPPASMALAMTHEPLRVVSMDAAMLYGSVGYLGHWPGTPEGDAEGEIISAALGNSAALLLCNHGLLTVGATVHEAVYRAVFFERAAAAQLSAQAVGPLKEVEPAAAESARHAMSRASYVNATMAYLYRKTVRTL